MAQTTYRLGPGRRLPPLVLDDDEAVAMVACLRMAAREGNDQVGEAALRALGKLDQVLPRRLADEVAAVDRATVALDRMTEVVGSTFRFTPRPAPDPRERMTQASAPGRWPCEAVVRFACPADRLSARIPANYGTVVGEADGWTLRHVGAPEWSTLAWHLAWAALDLDADLRVEEGSALAAALAEHGHRMLGYARVHSPG